MTNAFARLRAILFDFERVEETPLPSPEEELCKLKRQLDAARSRFAFAVEDGETEAAIYELSALESRYRLLMRRCRAETENERDSDINTDSYPGTVSDIDRNTDTAVDADIGVEKAGL